ncbi:MAG: lysine transporter LysE [Rhodobacteraceae bacterium]|nr:lysine transporter LysE [Paracoccaceae bacterium]|tara:strand:- start:231 stop:821 length:591 start_codon:yes stop_codon:yes gene_type:complete
MLTFSLAVTLLMLTPGPAVLMIANIGVNFDFRKGVPFVFGVIVGANVVALSVVLGIASVINTYTLLRLILLIISSIFIFYLAVKILMQNSVKETTSNFRKINFYDGLVLQILNPKNYIVQITLFSGFLIWNDNFILEAFIKLVIANMIWFPMHLLWLLLGVTLKKMQLSRKSLKILNMFMAGSLLSFIAMAFFNFE